MPARTKRLGSRRNRVSYLLGMAAAVLALPAETMAQTTTTVPWIQWTVVQVDPDMVDEYLAVQREITPLVKRSGIPWRSVSQTEVFGDTYRFLITNPVESLASFDQRKSDPKISVLTDRARKYIKGQQSHLVRTLPEIDNPLPEKQAPDLMVVNLVRVVPGREQDYMDLMRTDFLPHFNEAEFHHLNGTLTFGGESGFLHLFYIRNFSHLDEGSPVVRALGVTGAQTVTAKLSGIVTRTELWIARFLPELSYGPWTASSK